MKPLYPVSLLSLEQLKQTKPRHNIMYLIEPCQIADWVLPSLSASKISIVHHATIYDVAQSATVLFGWLDDRSNTKRIKCITIILNHITLSLPCLHYNVYLLYSVVCIAHYFTFCLSVFNRLCFQLEAPCRVEANKDL